MQAILAWIGRFLAGAIAEVVRDWRADRARERIGRLAERDAAAAQRDDWRRRMGEARAAVDRGGAYAERVRERFTAGGQDGA